MFVRKVLLDSHLRRVVNCQIIRSIKGKIKIPVQLTERKSPLKDRRNSRYLRQVRKSNVGIGNTLRAYMEYYGKDIDDDFDPEDMQEEIGLDDIEPKIENLEMYVEYFICT